MNDLQDFKLTFDLVEFIGRDVELKKHGNVFKGLCPFHDDTNPSFDVVPSTQKFRCWSCGAKGDIFDYVRQKEHLDLKGALARLGYAQWCESRLAPARQPSPAKVEDLLKDLEYIEEYSYTDVAGNYVSTKVRFYNRAKNSKDFKRWVKKNRSVKEFDPCNFHWSLKSLTQHRNILYHAPRVKEAICSDQTIYICEGEKAVHRIEREGRYATCEPQGATGLQDKSLKWDPANTELLRGAHLIIVADRDEVGERHASLLADELMAGAKSLKIVSSKTTNYKDDAFDHLEAGFSLAEFVDRPELIPGLEIEGLAPETDENFQPVKPEFLWEPYLWLGQCCMFSADSGLGKSSFTLAMLAGFSNGKLPNGEGDCEPIEGVYFIGDADDYRSYETLYREHEGVPNKVRWISGIRPLTQLVCDLKKYIARNPKCKYAVVDPFANFMAASGFKDSNSGVEMVVAAGILADVASELGILIWMVHHDGKGGDYLGSAMIKARVRGYLQAKWHPTERGLVVVRDKKGSILADRGKPFAFRRERRGAYGIIEYVMSWPPTEEDEGYSPPKGRPPVNRQTAEQFVKEYFSRCTYALQESVIAAGEEEGLSRSTLWRALKALGGKSTKAGFGDGKYRWHLPPKEDPFLYE